MSQPDPTAAEERRAEEERLIAERNAAQHAAEADGSAERVLLMPPEGYAVEPGGDGEAEATDQDPTDQDPTDQDPTEDAGPGGSKPPEYPTPT